MTWQYYPLLCNREKLRRELIAGKKVNRIARELGCSRATIEAAMRHHQLRKPFIAISEQTRKKLRL